MKTQNCEIGMVDLEARGRNLLLNMPDHRPSVTGCDKDATKIKGVTRGGRISRNPPRRELEAVCWAALGAARGNDLRVDRSSGRCRHS